MAHNDVCPCQHGNYVCLIGCDECFPDLVIPDTWQEQFREIHHRIAVENERTRAALAELVRLKDGPRDDAYYAAKPHAWQAAREALAWERDR